MAADRDRDYEVGYGKPPSHARFKKGRSGNPQGRPKGAKNSTTLLNEALSEPVVITHNGRRKTVSKKQAIMMQIVNKAASGDHRAIQLLLLNQIPLIEERLAATQPATGEAPLVPRCIGGGKARPRARDRKNSEGYRLSRPGARPDS
jgi:Family of unknown function (DUF5681)